MKPILVLQHVPHETLGALESVFAEAGFGCRYPKLFDLPPDELDLAAVAGLVVLGGPMNVDQTDVYPYLAREVEWIRDAIQTGLPVLGICLGSQLMAKALGAKVRAAGTKQIGWYNVQLTPAANGDRLMAGCPSPMTVFQWHGDTFDLPAGAVRLAGCDTCENQAFRYGDRAYALQFHIEVTANMVQRWLDEPENSRELAGLDDIDPDEIRRRMPQELPPMQTIGAKVFGRFAAICREGA